MNWHSTAMILAAFAAAALAAWVGPFILNPLGLAEFVLVTQLGLAIVALSVLEAVFARLPVGQETGHEAPDP